VAASRKSGPRTAVASIYSATNYQQTDPCCSSGAHNANGSKKFRDAMLDETGTPVWALVANQIKKAHTSSTSALTTPVPMAQRP